jgi:hypothetical protein
VPYLIVIKSTSKPLQYFQDLILLVDPETSESGKLALDAVISETVVRLQAETLEQFLELCLIILSCVWRIILIENTVSSSLHLLRTVPPFFTGCWSFLPIL